MHIRGVALVAWLAVLPSWAQDVESVSSRDGPRYLGPTRMAGTAVIVATRLADCYLTPAEVAARAKSTPGDEPPSYPINAALLTGKKQGVVGPVVKDMTWGTWNADGTVPIKLTDLKLGALSFTLAISLISPSTVRLEGIEYDKRLVFSTRMIDGMLDALIAPSVDRTDPAALRKAVAFYVAYGALDRAAALLAGLEALAPADAGLPELRVAIERARVAAAVDEALRLAALDRHEDADRLLVPVTASAALVAAEPELARALDVAKTALSRLAALVARVRRYLELNGVTVAALDPTRAETFARLAGLGETGGGRGAIDAALLPALLEPWADALSAADLAPERLREAMALAKATADVLALPMPPAARASELAARYGALEKSRALPRSLLLAILAHARRFDPPPPGERWRKVAFDYPPRAPVAGKAPKFHYYVQVPTSYRPGRPTAVLVSLHGQTSTAATQVGFWGELAERHGMILVAPEYIYGREWGYRWTVEEHTAILGAIHHAAGELDIDPDRVFLQGASQGGHASWDIGGTQGARFAGVIPIIGCPMTHALLPGFLNTRLYCIDGSDDGSAPGYNRATMEPLARLGARARYVEYRNRGHDSFSEEYETVCRWMRATRRATAPAEVWLAAFRASDTRSRWLEIDASRLGAAWDPRNPERMATAHGRFDRTRNRFELEATGTAKLTLLVDAGLVDLDRALEVEVEDHTLKLGKTAVDWPFAVASLIARRDGSELFVAHHVISLSGRIGPR